MGFLKDNKVLLTILGIVLAVLIGMYYASGDNVHTPDLIKDRDYPVRIDPPVVIQPQMPEKPTKNNPPAPETPEAQPPAAPTPTPPSSQPNPPQPEDPNSPTQPPNSPDPDIEVDIPGVGSVELTFKQICQKVKSGASLLSIAAQTGLPVGQIVAGLTKTCKEVLDILKRPMLLSSLR